ncbi:MAG: WS/DGAT domain-containing protein [Gammaproteobacteria bacterium]|nr:WS/DGAT domain-containing protein [Gammaproteobacteria bacterium]MDE0365714.1 WS/DGAT domain-containing protein [Gammaproteobacteria bacterium]
MRRLRPDDDYMIRLETENTPQHIGALQHYDCSGLDGSFFDAVAAHFARRLPATPLLCRRRRAPLGYDADVWLDLAGCDLSYHVQRVPTDAPMSPAEVRAFIEAKVVERIDLTRPPFMVYLFDKLSHGADESGAPTGPGSVGAIYLKVHHCVADGVGFQNIVGLLTDPTPEPVYDVPPRDADEKAPPAALWMARSAARFRREARLKQAQSAQRNSARAAYRAFRADPANRRAPTPVLKLAQKTGLQRRYLPLSLPLDRVRAAGKRLGGSVNDAFLAVAAGALRRTLIEVDDLPDQPLVAVAARSYRKPEHGLFGNRIITLNPSIHVELADPVERFKAIQRSTAIEVERARLTEPLISEFDSPFGARKRYADYARRTAGGQAVIAGNVTLSNVPGPAEPVYLAGARMLTNYPTPILGSGRFLNITLRRYCEHLDLGIMTDPEQLGDVDALGQYLADALDELARA